MLWALGMVPIVSGEAGMDLLMGLTPHLSYSDCPVTLSLHSRSWQFILLLQSEYLNTQICLQSQDPAYFKDKIEYKKFEMKKVTIFEPFKIHSFRSCDTVDT